MSKPLIWMRKSGRFIRLCWSTMYVRYFCDPFVLHRYKTGPFTQLYWLIWRELISKKRDPLATKVQIINTIMFAVIFGLIYLRLDITSDNIQNINGVIFLCITNTTFGNLFPVLQVCHYFLCRCCFHVWPWLVKLEAHLAEWFARQSCKQMVSDSIPSKRGKLFWCTRSEPMLKRIRKEMSASLPSCSRRKRTIIIVKFHFNSLIQKTFAAEIPIFLKENKLRMYRVFNYYLSRVLTEVIFKIMKKKIETSRPLYFDLDF